MRSIGSEGTTNREIFKNLSGVLNAIIYAAEPEKSLWPAATTNPESKAALARLALTGAARPSLPVGERNHPCCNLGRAGLSPAGRDIGRGCIGIRVGSPSRNAERRQ